MTQPQQIPETDAPPGEPWLAAVETAVAATILTMFTAWLASASVAVLAGGIVNPAAIWGLLPAWDKQVDRLMTDLVRMAKRGWEQAASDLGVNLPFDPDSDVLQDQLRRTRNLLVRIPDEIYRQILFELGQALDAGEDVAAQVARIRGVLDVNGAENWPARAKTIAVTEVNRAFSFGGLAAAQTAQSRIDVGLFKHWEAHDDTATRPAHRRADRQTVPIFQPFIVDDEALMMPGDPSGRPSNVINCVQGKTPIIAASVKKAFRYPYTGSMLTLSCESGRSLTVSPNHPVLSETGWVVARQLDKGDHLIGARNSLLALPVNPNVEAAPSTAEEIFDSLMLTGLSHRVMGLPVDFHGDGPDSDIDVVLVDRELSFGLNASNCEHFDQLCFAFANSPDASGGALDELFVATLDSPDSVMGSKDLSLSLTGVHSAPFKELGITSATQGNAENLELLSEGGPGDVSLLGEGLHGSPIEVFRDKVVDIVREFFSGHLYTFETESGVYLSEGIVSHNCRCRARFRKGV